VCPVRLSGSAAVRNAVCAESDCIALVRSLVSTPCGKRLSWNTPERPEVQRLMLSLSPLVKRSFDRTDDTMARNGVCRRSPMPHRGANGAPQPARRPGDTDHAAGLSAQLNGCKIQPLDVCRPQFDDHSALAAWCPSRCADQILSAAMRPPHCDGHTTSATT
jgi:hypothetical protein